MMGLSKFSVSFELTASQTRALESQACDKVGLGISLFESWSLASQAKV